MTVPATHTGIRLRWPREVTSTQVLAALLTLRGLSRGGSSPMVLRAEASTDGVRHYVIVPRNLTDAARSQLAGAIPGLSQTEVAETDVSGVDIALRATVSNRLRPLRVDQPEQLATALLQAMTGLHKGEALVVQWSLGRPLRPMSIGSRAPGDPTGAGVSRFSAGLLFGASELDSDARSALRTKQGLPGWRAALHIGVVARTPGRRRQLLEGVVAAMSLSMAPGVSLRFARTRPAALAGRRLWRWPNSINAAELTGIVGWPIGITNGLPVEQVVSRQLPPPKQMSRKGRAVAMSTTDPGRPLVLSADDATRHLHVIGPTGVGKSTLLLHLIEQDMVAGRAVVVIEPRGDLISDVLARVPDRRVDEVVLLDPTDRRPVGLNPLTPTRDVSSELAVDHVLAIFKGLFRDSWGPRTQDILTAGLLTLTESEHPSLIALPLLLTDQSFRSGVLRSVSDPLALDPFWRWYEDLSAAERAAVIAPVMNKLRAFLLRPAVRRVLGQTKPRFAMRQVFTERRILLVNLAKGRLGPEASGLLGSLVFSSLWQTTLSRSGIDPTRRHPVMVYIDEFQDYLHLPTDLAEVLAQARGLGVGLTLAHQHLGQLSPTIRPAVMANARSRVIFQTGDDDARVLARSDERIDPRDITGLGRYEVYASLVTDGEVTPFASGRTIQPSEPRSNPKVVADRSRQQWGTDVADIDEQIAGVHTEVEADSPAEAFGVRTRPPVGEDDRGEGQL